MSYQRQSVEREGYQQWLDNHRAPNGWGAAEFDILASNDAPATLIGRIWGRNPDTIKKYIRVWKRDKTNA